MSATLTKEWAATTAEKLEEALTVLGYVHGALQGMADHGDEPDSSIASLCRGALFTLLEQIEPTAKELEVASEDEAA
jgi:hypothetical protein